MEITIQGVKYDADEFCRANVGKKFKVNSGGHAGDVMTLMGYASCGDLFGGGMADTMPSTSFAFCLTPISEGLWRYNTLGRGELWLFTGHPTIGFYVLPECLEPICASVEARPQDDKFPHRCPVCGGRAYVGTFSGNVEHEDSNKRCE